MEKKKSLLKTITIKFIKSVLLNITPAHSAGETHLSQYIQGGEKPKHSWMQNRDNELTSELMRQITA